MCNFNFMQLPADLRGQVFSHLHFADLNTLSTVSRELNAATRQGSAASNVALDRSVRARANALHAAILEAYDVGPRDNDAEDTRKFESFSKLLGEYCLAYWRAALGRQLIPSQLTHFYDLIRTAMQGRLSDKVNLRRRIPYAEIQGLIERVRVAHPMTQPRSNAPHPGECPGGCNEITS